MSTDTSPHKTRPTNVGVTTSILKFLVFITFAFILYEATVGLGHQDLSANRVWVIIAGMAGLLLLLAIDRLVELRVSPTGMQAKLFKAQAQALMEVGALEDREVVEAAQAQILQAENETQVEAARAFAVDLNVGKVIERVEEAIEKRQKVYVRYRSKLEGPVESYLVAPLDIKPGETPGSRAKDYFWVHSYRNDRSISLRLDRVLGIELSEETFDPAELIATWDESPEWNIPRDW